MKALTLKDEDYGLWASWVRDGSKTIETRKWKTSYRGDLLITCSKSSTTEFAGMAICIVELYDIQNMKEEHEKNALVYHEKNLYSWFFRNVRPLKPFPAKGKLGLFNVDLPEDLIYE